VLRLGDHLVDVPCVALGCPTCRRADVPCICIADLRWGAQLVDVPCVALGRPTCGHVLCCVWAPILRTCLALRWRAQPWWGRIKNSTSKPKFVLIHPPAHLLAYCSLVWKFSLRMSFAFGRPSYGRPLCCVGAPNLRTCRRALRLRCGCPLGCPTYGRALLCIGALNLRMCLALRWGAQLADVPCVAFGRPSCGRALRCVGAPNLGEAVLKSLPPSQNLFLSILQLVF
jgi:hypothetical protein